MASQFSYPERIVRALSLAPAADAAGRTGTYVSLKNAVKAWIEFDINQGNAATIACSMSTATAVAGTGAAAGAILVPVWSNLDCAASSIIVARAAAANYTTDAGVKVKKVVFEIDPGIFGTAVDCIAAVTGASNAANITSAYIVIEPKWAGSVTPEMMLD